MLERRVKVTSQNKAQAFTWAIFFLAMRRQAFGLLSAGLTLRAYS